MLIQMTAMQVFDAEIANFGNRVFKNTSHAFTVLASILAMIAISTFTGMTGSNLL
jgi:hypothetical protein